MPAAIRLASEPPLDMTPVSRFSSSQKETLQVNKTRRSLPNTARSQSSLSIRSATPAFTLRPAYNKANPAPRHSSSHPEIRVYHLSRHGDAPIKLHIRRVGESGERLMVRTGGGWADLGEYLTAYIHHHGRRIASGQGEDKVEVRNLGAGMGNRTASSSSTNFRASKGSTSNGRESPGPRSNSVLSMDRPMSSLFVRKTRRSVGETESRTSMVQIRNPSTPVPARQETPEAGDSAKTASRLGNRSVSRQEWTEEDRGLGLAGPGSKRKDISETEQEWVRSTTEKVKQASAEKEKGKEKVMEKSGTTRRLFRKE
ncbi:hypothetical protein B0O99DRAFT_641714 [Bisporella sp. PMI_857]|nr:hypothetical protein B0O99DRAFT_641714 [Bisporella sp. PMI_857]